VGGPPGIPRGDECTLRHLCESISELGDQLRKNADTIHLRVLSTDIDIEIQRLIEEIRGTNQR
jgi:hypothetical protein